MHCLAKVATVITAIVRMRRWLKCRQRAIKARAADALVMPPVLRPSAVPMHTDVAGESIVDTAEATAMEEEELIAEAPSISSRPSSSVGTVTSQIVAMELRTVSSANQRY